MEQPLYRKKSLERISSPEQLDEYLHVTNPAVWILLGAVILILVGMLLWSASASIDSYVTGTAQVEKGKMTIRFDDPTLAGNVREGMEVRAGETKTRISSIGKAEDGSIIASAECQLADGSYPVRVNYRKTQLIRLLFN